MWGEIVIWAIGLDPVLQTLIILLIGWGIKIGVIQIPFIKNISKRNTPITHEECVNYKSFVEEKNNERNKSEAIFQIKYFETVYNQMSYVETTGIKVADMLTDNFDDRIAKESLSEVQRTEALQIYQMIVDGAIDNACGYLRKWVKHNGFTSYDDMSFQKYIHERSEETQKIIKKYIDRKYLKSQLFVDRKDLYDSNMIIFYENIQVMLSDMFVKLRAIAEASEKKIKSIEMAED